MFSKTILVVVSLVLFSGSVNAETGHKKGTVQYIRVHDAMEHPAWAPPIFWFTLNGVTSAGTCPVWNGNVLFAMDSEQAMSIVLAAQMAVRDVAIRFDDAKKHSGDHWCKATYITIGENVPLS